MTIISTPISPVIKNMIEMIDVTKLETSNATSVSCDFISTKAIMKMINNMSEANPPDNWLFMPTNNSNGFDELSM